MSPPHLQLNYSAPSATMGYNLTFKVERTEHYLGNPQIKKLLTRVTLVLLIPYLSILKTINSVNILPSLCCRNPQITT